ncbi:hypothetical protein HHK36_013086 [Tetracentron sinense]|uniref:Cytochrome P450 n=1 Tax=Tetracentron sinense TaxID=13715 RepID=A0A834Z717_TETSI|nr:hypothetical protein HHK36_013086 [Tetracentron sinense]
MDFLFQLQAIGGVAALIVLYYYLWRVRTLSHKSKGVRAPELPGAWPFLGHLHLLGGKDTVARTLGTLADKYGPAFTLRLGMHRGMVVSSWELIKECLTTNDTVFSSRPNSAAGKYLAYDYALFGFASYGPYWRDMRKMSTVELLSNRRLEKLKQVRTTEVDTCIKKLYSLCAKNNEASSSSSSIMMNEWFEQLTFNVITMMVAGKRYFGNIDAENESEALRFRRAIRKFMYLSGVFVVSDVIPYLEWMDLQGYVSSMKRTAEELDSLISGWLEEHIRKRDSSESKGEQDFIDTMLSVLSQNTMPSNPKRDTIIKATALNLIVAGSDSTSLTLTWALSLLLNNDKVLKRAQEELDVYIGKDRFVEESDIRNLVYLQAIVKETLRLYPAGPLLVPREAIEDCHVGGYYVPKGTRLFVNIWKLHRDPSVWSDPCEFKPERFLTKHADLDTKGLHFEYIPFSSGRRSCPGMTFGLQVLHLTLARLLHEFNLTTPSNAPMDMTEGLGLTLPKATPVELDWFDSIGNRRTIVVYHYVDVGVHFVDVDVIVIPTIYQPIALVGNGMHCAVVLFVATFVHYSIVTTIDALEF